MAIAELEVEQSTFAIDDFLSIEAAKDLLRFSTAGSVDDGKSTLIGRLLYDSRNVYEDQVRAVTGTPVVGSRQPAIDFALLTDGLRAEREQGITIDVAYRYFSTTRRKFIIADTPGHEQYTRNMATGASTADLAIILIDARKGILLQSRRHAFIASLLGTRHLVAAINKMDLVDFSQHAFEKIEADLRDLVRSIGNANLTTIPVSALLGDNVVERSANTSWYAGPTVLEHLEAVPVHTDAAARPFRLPVQRVIRPDQNYRGFAGQVAAGTLRKGDAIMALPSGRTSRIAAITTFGGELDEATVPLSIAVTLEDELDISRGDTLVDPIHPPQHATSIEADIVWFDTNHLETHRPYLVKHGAQTLPARITRVLRRTNVETLADEPVGSLAMNEIGLIQLNLTRPLFFDPYTENRSSGAFILIDPQTNATLAAGMIRRAVATGTAATRSKAALITMASGTHTEAWLADLEEQLITAGALVIRTQIVTHNILRAFLDLGLIVIVTADNAALQPLSPINASDFATPREITHHLQAGGILESSQEVKP